MTAATLKNPGSCRQCGGTGIVVAADGANFDPCAVCQPAGGVYKVKVWKAPAVPSCDVCGMPRQSSELVISLVGASLLAPSLVCKSCAWMMALPLPCL